MRRNFIEIWTFISRPQQYVTSIIWRVVAKIFRIGRWPNLGGQNVSMFRKVDANSSQHSILFSSICPHNFNNNSIFCENNTGMCLCADKMWPVLAHSRHRDIWNDSSDHAGHCGTGYVQCTYICPLQGKSSIVLCSVYYVVWRVLLAVKQVITHRQQKALVVCSERAPLHF